VKVLKLVDWMDVLNLRVCAPDITHEQISDDDYTDRLKKYKANKDTLVLELRTSSETEPWIIGLVLDVGVVVLVPWWYFREVEL
jgi:hypothetical protein